MLPMDVIRLCDAKAAEFSLPGAHVAAVVEVESNGNVFYTVEGEKRPAILFEPHIFDRRLEGAARDEARALGLASPKWNKKLYGKTQPKRWQQIEAAVKLLKRHGVDPWIAYECASYGVGQVMGYHWKALSFQSMQHFMEVMMSGAEGQIDIMLRYVVVNSLDDELRDGRWAAFARGYNGPGYKKNRYDTKMGAAALRYGGDAPEADGMLRMGSKGAKVRELQTLLVRAGFPVKVDGDFGPTTKKAVMAFQKANDLTIDGVVGPETHRTLSGFRQGAGEKPGDMNPFEIPEAKTGLGTAAGGVAVEMAQQKVDEATASLQQFEGISEWIGYGLTALTVIAAVLAFAGIAIWLYGWMQSRKTVEV